MALGHMTGTICSQCTTRLQSIIKIDLLLATLEKII
jgi:hypothetical protein